MHIHIYIYTCISHECRHICTAYMQIKNIIHTGTHYGTTSLRADPLIFPSHRGRPLWRTPHVHRGTATSGASHCSRRRWWPSGWSWNRRRWSCSCDARSTQSTRRWSPIEWVVPSTGDSIAINCLLNKWDDPPSSHSIDDL